MYHRSTITDVAKLAGVSTATAARVFDPAWAGKVRPATCEKVLQAAKQLDYHRGDALVRGIQGRGTNMIAVVVGPSLGYFYTDVLMRFVHALRLMGKQVLVFEVDPARDLSPIVEQVHNYRVDGVIITAAASATTLVQMIGSSSLPVVTFDVQSPNASCVFCDPSEAGETAADYLLSRGHRTFKVVTGNCNASAAPERSESFCSYVCRHGGQILEVLDADYGYESGRSAARKLFTGQLPDAVFCVEDLQALGVMDEARTAFGIRVPEDVSIMGYDGVSVGSYASYVLTTLRYPVEEMVQNAVEILQQLLENPQQRLQKVSHLQLCIRSSVTDRTTHK